MADELNWSGAFYESLAGSIGRVTRGGPVGMAAGVIGEASAAMRGMSTPWQGPRTTASLAAAVGGGFFLLNAGRGVVEAANAAGHGDYGSALANAAIGVGWYAAGRFALGALARGLPVEAGALAAYEKAAEANFAARDPDAYQRIISKFKKEQNIAEAAASSAAVASAQSINPNTAQAAAENAAETAADVVGTSATRRNAAPAGAPGVVTGGSVATVAPGVVTGGSVATVAPGVVVVGRTAAGPTSAVNKSPNNVVPAAGNPPPGYTTGGNPARIYTTGGNPPIANRRGFWSRAFGWFGGRRQAGAQTAGSPGRARRFFSAAGRRRLSSGWQAAQRWATMLASASRGKLF
jgi:hypothetical protein